MGLLDDAIREHLELKRRRGADPGEVAREQREALDPVPREASFADEDGGGGHVERARASDGQRFGLPEAGVMAVGIEEDMPDGFSDAAQPADAEGATEAANAGETAELDMRTVLGDDPTPGVAGGVRPAPVAGAPLRRDAPSSSGDSLEWEMPGDEAEAELEAEQQAEDVLEETPDFLRDTPEQDRLWFEQRPPRDFDFDK
ncbi:MAG TPA: hypothetical protein VGX69_13290 [Solirubrobacteraceae bacterium]|nr:hypothetical protein [Solirubrobacteraceae bacterium]